MLTLFEGRMRAEVHGQKCMYIVQRCDFSLSLHELPLYLSCVYRVSTELATEVLTDCKITLASSKDSTF